MVFLVPMEPSKPNPDPVVEVFEYWRDKMAHPRAQLDEKRRKVIRRALAHYSVADCRRAVDGCRASEWHMGTNPEGRRYDAIELILRSAEKIDAFMALAGEREHKKTKALYAAPKDELGFDFAKAKATAVEPPPDLSLLLGGIGRKM